MAGIFSVDDIRKSWGADWADAPDSEVINAYAGALKVDPTSVALKLGFDPGSGGKTAKRLSSSIDRYQGNLYELGEAVTGAMGLDRAQNWMRSGREDNELRANTAAARAKLMGAVDSYKDVNGVGDAADYVAGLGIQSLPYLGEALVGGLAGRALMGGTRAALGAAREAGNVEAATAAARRLAAGQTATAVGASYPSAVADVLSNQRDQNGQTDLGSALALGVPYSALNALGVEGALARQQLYRSGISALDDISGIKGGLARAGATGTRLGLTEGFAETGQEGLNQLGRMAVDPRETFLNPRSEDRFKESFVGGAALGFVPGAATGWRRSAPTQLLPTANPDPTPPPAPLQLGYNPSAGAYTVFPDGSVATNSEQAFDYRYAPQSINPTAPLDFYPASINERPADPYAYQGAIPFETVGITRPPAQAVQSEVPLVSGQGDLFDPLREGAQDVFTPPAAPEAPPVDTQTGDLFDVNPTALVRTGFDRTTIRRAINSAVDGKQDRFTLGLTENVAGRIEDPVQALQFLDAAAERNATSAVKPETAERRAAAIEAARQVVQDYQRQFTYALAAEGVNKAQPGFTAQAPDLGNATEMQMREAQSLPLDAPAPAPAAPTLADQIADTDVRAQSGDERRAQQERMSILQGVLDDPTTVNPVGRFRAQLRRAGFRNQDLLPQEQQAINRFSDAQEAFGQPDVAPAAPNEMDPGLVPERRSAPAAAPQQPAPRPNGAFRLTPPPSTQEDLDALAAAQAKRERRANAEEPAAPQEPAAPATRSRAQGILFTQKGEPSAAATATPSDATAPKPKRTKKVKVGSAEFEVMDADRSIEVLQQRLEDLKQLKACLL